MVAFIDAVVAILGESPQPIGEAIQSALSQPYALTAHARISVARVAEHHAAARFRQLLLES